MDAKLKSVSAWRLFKWAAVATLALMVIYHPWLGSAIAIFAIVLWATEKTTAKAAPICAGGCPRQISLPEERQSAAPGGETVPGKKEVMRTWVALF